jgi:hypothetical protein
LSILWEKELQYSQRGSRIFRKSSWCEIDQGLNQVTQVKPRIGAIQVITKSAPSRYRIIINQGKKSSEMNFAFFTTPKTMLCFCYKPSIDLCIHFNLEYLFLKLLRLWIHVVNNKLISILALIQNLRITDMYGVFFFCFSFLFLSLYL